MTNTVSFNVTTFRKLKKEYENAIQNNITIFTFEGNEYLTSYAKYMVEYLKTKFEK
jgi:hypothetical protein